VAKAALAPRTLHSRIAVPSSSATSASIAWPVPSSCSSSASTILSSAASAASGSAEAARASVSGLA